jgi:hypothetical protein
MSGSVGLQIADCTVGLIRNPKSEIRNHKDYRRRRESACIGTAVRQGAGNVRRVRAVAKRTAPRIESARGAE